MMRHDGRTPQEIRPVRFERGFAAASAGSVLVRSGSTVILVTANLVDQVPPFLEGRGTGWLTAEYAMLPGSTPSRKPRKVDGRCTEIQRLIGRSLRAMVDLERLGPRTLHLDADVIQADGGTRTAAITAACVATADALNKCLGAEEARAILKGRLAAVSVGVVDGVGLLDLDYSEDVRAEVDLNVVRLGPRGLVEVQGTAEGAPFDRRRLEELLDLADQGIDRLMALQLDAVGPGVFPPEE
ncbi:RNAse PH [Isosphaera pallida ATCC 43644]|uniref:Ribonuclease PH n=1 Tax=Isosphaera pallida (strain ATCC 43644 / DSM 9630 / IS1B) TaxID=575540 RepID=E8R6S6_ISOPI|nr:ribonuclease PH [Isosphaera pallida]ADV63978.1 RNAse PH [Isosphaera pallida ATCC 43644]